MGERKARAAHRKAHPGAKLPPVLPPPIPVTDIRISLPSEYGEMLDDMALKMKTSTPVIAGAIILQVLEGQREQQRQTQSPVAPQILKWGQS